jgi:hypothetical protein
MLGINAMPRWRLPGLLLLALVLAGCAARTEQGGRSSLSLPSVRMALVKIPLNGGDAGEDVLKNEDPMERFTPEPVALASAPAW